MRHRVASHQFNRHTKGRKALLMNMVRSLLETGSVTTTKAKAIELARIADKVIARAQRNDLTSRRVLHRFFGKRDVVNTLVDTIAPAFADRKSGFTTMSVLGTRRGDAALLAKVSLVSMPEKMGSFKPAKKPVAATKKSAPAEKKAAEKTEKVVKKATKK